ncbi:LPS-assembly protein LptD [Ottowia thiooxydans]|uniref:LPS-assembly protein LptD n=1 Tax=Ottowia thiooxydans TaxID=219182 RepID=UPI00041BD5D6|nr:LPS assembly protein LptD [Ottowia thiooxydans]
MKLPFAARPRSLHLAVLALLAGPAWAQSDKPLPLRDSQMLEEQLPSTPKAPTLMQGERLTGRTELETVIEGEAQLRRPGMTVSGDRLTYDQATDRATIQGNVQVNSAGNRYTGTEGELQVDAFEGHIQKPTYEFLSNGAHGQAERIDFLDEDRAIIRNANYTTCRRDGPDWMPAWLLRASQMRIDQEEQVGEAEGAVLEFKGVPVPLPSMSFPLGDRRKSGWLPPAVGLDSTSGLILSVPYYWNIAPNRDATIIPTAMLRRGVDMAGEFRYLENDYNGRINANYMPNDKLRGESRWGFFGRHNGSINTGIDAIGQLGFGLNLNRVSDDNYWRDFSRSGLSLTTRLLANDAAVNWGRGDFSLTARVLKWQTLQDVTSPIIPPYDRLPQITGRWGRTNVNGGFDYRVEGDFTRFRADPSLTFQPNADRGVLFGEVSRPWLRSWGFFTPRMQVHARSYQFDRPLSNGQSSHNRLVPTMSLDGGLVFERDASYFGRAFLQTLEPRVKYVYTPYRNQSMLPNYDAGAYDFNFATIWSENAFAGHDRVVDNNLVTFGLTSRLLDPDTGGEVIRLGIAQRYRFVAQQVTLPGGKPADKGLSDIMLGASINWSPTWAFDSVAQYNIESRNSTRTTLGVRYSPGDYRTVSLAYRRERDLNSQQIDLGWQWPLNDLWGDRGQDLGRGQGQGAGRWYTVGRLNYSVPDRKLVDGVLGIEYDAGCWIGRVVVEKLQSSISSSTKRIMFQLEFVGFSRVGSNPLRTLHNNIPRYQYLREEITSPSRFTQYD